MAVQHFTIHEVIHFITDIPGDGVGKENLFREEGDTEFGPTDCQWL